MNDNKCMIVIFFSSINYAPFALLKCKIWFERMFSNIRFIQVMTPEQAASWKFNPFDLTKVWPQGEFPLIPVGKMTLDRNPKNYFAEVEQSAFAPANLVPGIEASPDKMLQVIKTMNCKVDFNHLQ